MLVEFKFKEQLAKIKKEQNLTISQIADGIGVSSRTVDYHGNQFCKAVINV